MAGTWTTLTNPPPNAVCTTFLLTDGTVLAQGVSTNHWYRLTPDANGDYGNGTWTTMADSTNGPLYYASGILRDGRLIVVGGEYNFGTPVWLQPKCTTPSPRLDGGPRLGLGLIGDAPGCVSRRAVYRREVTTTRKATTSRNTEWICSKQLRAGRGSGHSFRRQYTRGRCSHPQTRSTSRGEHLGPAGATPQVLVDSISEIGASLLLPDGRLFVIGATGFSAIYTVPPIANQPGTWANGPTIPQVNPGEALGTVDAPAAILPNGRVLFSASHITSTASFQTHYFFEYDRPPTP